MRVIPEEPANGFIVSPGFDLLFILGPVFLSGLAALCIPDGTELSDLGWVVLVLGVDVSHVWATLYRTYLDPDELSRRPILYLFAPLTALVGCSSLAALYPALFWRVLAYLAVFHFARQVLGIGMLYRARSGRSTRDLGGRIERAALYVVTLGPVLWWHASLPLPFEWFVPGDFVPIPRWTLLPVGITSGIVLTLHAAMRLSERQAAWGSDGWLLGQAIVWGGGVLWARSDAAFTLGNVVAHGVPYVALVWWTSRRRWAIEGIGALSQAFFRPRYAALFVGMLLGLALLEEGLWDIFVWQERPALFGDIDLSDYALPATAILSVPQVTHYLLDGFLWRMGKGNPSLGALLGLPVKPGISS